MNKSVQELDAIVVSGKKSSIEETNAGTFELSLEKVEKLPVFMGEKDVIKTLQLFPGVSSGGEGTSGLYVRGGGPDQNLVLLDGVPIYNANHLFGFFSVFNSDALSKVTMIKGGFPARYGGRTSSVLNMKMKEGNLKKYNGELEEERLVVNMITENNYPFQLS
jgi:outer membrane cobalamin receptor